MASSVERTPRVQQAADVLIGGTQILVISVTAPIARHRYNTWGASPREAIQSMPGDDLVPQPKLGYTRAVTIRAAPRDVWPWLVQMGQGRGGLYSFDGLENLVGCRIHSATRVLAEHQELAPDDLIRLGPIGYPCFRVASVDPESSLVLVGADPQPPHRAAEPEAPGGIATWQWQLAARDGGRATRLLVRQRLTYPEGRGIAAMWHVVEPVAFVMERQMLLRLKARAEANPTTG